MNEMADKQDFEDPNVVRDQAIADLRNELYNAVQALGHCDGPCREQHYSDAMDALYELDSWGVL